MLPVSIPLRGLSPATIAGAINCVQPIEPEETGQSIMDMDTNEISIARIIGFDWKDTGTDVEDELPTPASSPAQIAVPAIPPVGTAILCVNCVFWETISICATVHLCNWNYFILNNIMPSTDRVCSFFVWTRS